ncbi:MAG: hypothetical protein KHY77_09760, partial [Butyricicoccus pullicaecorum]|nr:hypothetical protein [Butyricicoccus pullicaecorum]
MRLVNFFRIVLAAARVLLLIEFAKTTRSTGGFDCDVKPLARRVVQKKAIAEDEEIKTPFAIIKK